MADSRIPSDVMSFAKWGRTKIEFGKTMVRAVAKSQDLGFPQYPEKTHYFTRRQRKSLLGGDFVKYLAIKERYFGVHEDELYLQAQSQARKNDD